MISPLSLKTLATSAAVLAFAISNASPAAAVVANRALGKPATSLLSSQCTAGSGPENAVDGAKTDIYNDKWCAKTVGTSHLKVDLGAKYYLTGFAIAHAGAAGENPTYNTRNFYVRASADGIYWITVAVVSNNTAPNTFSFVSTGMPGGGRTYHARYVELVVTQATQAPATLLTTQVTRIFEFEVYGSDTCETSCI